MQSTVNCQYVRSYGTKPSCSTRRICPPSFDRVPSLRPRRLPQLNLCPNLMLRDYAHIFCCAVRNAQKGRNRITKSDKGRIRMLRVTDGCVDYTQTFAEIHGAYNGKAVSAHHLSSSVMTPTDHYGVRVYHATLILRWLIGSQAVR